MNIVALVADAAPFSLLALLACVTSPVWVVCLMSLFVANKRLRLITGTTTALSGLFILVMGVAAYFSTLAIQPFDCTHNADPGRAAEAVREHRHYAAQELALFEAVGVLPLLVGGAAAGLGARMSPEQKE